MSGNEQEFALSRAADHVAAFRRIAARERAEAVRASARGVVDWLQRGLALRYSDDALTHPAAGKPCQC